MDLTFFFALLGSLLVLAFVANRLVKYTRVPDVIILMASGVLIGPVLHWVNPDLFRGAMHGFGTLALILILFEGGLELKLREILQHFGAGFFLAVFSYMLCSAAVAGICHGEALPPAQRRDRQHRQRIPQRSFHQHRDPHVRSQAHLLQHRKQNRAADAPQHRAYQQRIEPGKMQHHTKAVAWTLGSSLILAVACDILAGMLWSYLLPFLSEERFWHVLTFAAVLLVYSGVHFLQGNDLVSVLIFGLTLSNFSVVREQLHFGRKASADWFAETPIRAPRAGLAGRPHDAMLSFHGELAFLLRTFFFVLLGSFVEFAGLRSNIVLAVMCFAGILVARLVVVQAGRLAWRGFSTLERELMVWFVPRGLITAVLGIEVLQARGSEFAFLPSLAFAVVLLTNLILLVGTVRARKLPVVEVEA